MDPSARLKDHIFFAYSLTPKEISKGSFAGAIYADHSGKRWLGKLSTVGCKPADPFNDYHFRDAVKEKISADLYKLLASAIQDEFQLPGFFLAKLPVINQFTQTHDLTTAVVEGLNQGRPQEKDYVHETGIQRSKIKKQKEKQQHFHLEEQTPREKERNQQLSRLSKDSLFQVFVISEWMEDYKDIREAFVRDEQGQIIPFMKYLKTGKIPDSIFLNEKVVPLKGFIELLATGRLLGDVDILGRKGSNAGFLLVKNEKGEQYAKMIKVDPSSSLTLEGSLLYFTNYPPKMDLTNALMLEDLRDIQIGKQSELILKWENFTQPQRERFLKTIKIGINLLPKEIKFILERDGIFNNKQIFNYDLVSEKFKLETTMNIDELVEMQISSFGLPLFPIEFRKVEEMNFTKIKKNIFGFENICELEGDIVVVTASFKFPSHVDPKSNWWFQVNLDGFRPPNGLTKKENYNFEQDCYSYSNGQIVFQFVTWFGFKKKIVINNWKGDIFASAEFTAPNGPISFRIPKFDLYIPGCGHKDKKGLTFSARDRMDENYKKKRTLIKINSANTLNLLIKLILQHTKDPNSNTEMFWNFFSSDKFFPGVTPMAELPLHKILANFTVVSEMGGRDDGVPHSGKFAVQNPYRYWDHNPIYLRKTSKDMPVVCYKIPNTKFKFFTEQGTNLSLLAMKTSLNLLLFGGYVSDLDYSFDVPEKVTEGTVINIIQPEENPLIEVEIFDLRKEATVQRKELIRKFSTIGSVQFQPDEAVVGVFGSKGPIDGRTEKLKEYTMEEAGFTWTSYVLPYFEQSLLNYTPRTHHTNRVYIADTYAPYKQYAQIFVKTLNGTTITIEVDVHQTVHYFAFLIMLKEGILCEEQRLVFSGKQLEFDRTLTEHGICQECTIHLLLRLRSDRRLKKNISQIGNSQSGIPIYSFHYNWEDSSKLRIGTMAQDLISIGRSDAVTVGDDGFYLVDYGLLDVPFL